jgi:hypothetical protein
VDNAKSVAHSPTGEQKQKKRTFDVLPKPANLIRYRQPGQLNSQGNRVKEVRDKRRLC